MRLSFHRATLIDSLPMSIAIMFDMIYGICYLCWTRMKCGIGKGGGILVVVMCFGVDVWIETVSIGVNGVGLG